MTVTARTRTRGWRRLWFGFGLALVLLWIYSSQASAQGEPTGAYFVPGNPKAGMHVFFDKGCGVCHAVLGEGGHSAPDLARAPSRHLGATELLAAMWNHAPTMWERMQVQRVALPRFQEQEMDDLFAFLYSVRSLDEPGDPERGRQLLSEKNCVRCHALSGQGARVGPDLEKWADHRNPVSWIQTMWNHGPAMQSLMEQQGLPWPRFQDSDLSDLIAYIRKAAPRPRSHVYLRPADPEAGRALFGRMGCLSCHAIRGRGGRRGPDLGTSSLPRTLGQFAAGMWNHGPAMWSSMRAIHVRQQQFSRKEMADLIAYLFAQRYFDTAGNAERGQRLFERKGCAGCHEGGEAPSLAEWRDPSPIVLGTALWNHGPVMLRAMEQQEVSWPHFEPGEIADLLEYLNRKSPVQTARGGKE